MPDTTTTLQLPGKRLSAAESSAAGSIAPARGSVIRTTAIETIAVSGIRGAEGHAEQVDVPADCVVEVELENGMVFWRNLEDLRSDPTTSQARSATGDAFDIPPFLGSRAGSRGAATFAIKFLRFIGVDPIGDAADSITATVAEKIEGQLQNGQPALYRCPSPAGLGALAAETDFARDKPALVLLHGTASSTTGSFGALAEGRNGAPRPYWDQLQQKYGDNIFAFEHRTLTESPIINALQLVSALPANTKLDFISHSRGGIVGEFVARAQSVLASDPATPVDPFGDLDFAALEKSAIESGLSGEEKNRLLAVRANQAAELRELNRLLREKRPRIGTFVRVACPARGTLLASQRLDTYLSILFNLLDHIPAVGQSVTVELLKEFAIAVAKTRTRPELFPGLEAQMPESPLINIVNRDGIALDSRLDIVAGDLQGTGFLGNLAAFATDLYYRQDHDLVVDTRAMLGGARREKCHYYFDKGGEVNHFSYFRNDRTAGKIVEALNTDDPVQAGFHKLADPDASLQVRKIRQLTGKRPVVVLLPGIMGSHLQSGSNRIWLDILDLVMGRISRLGVDQAEVSPDGTIDKYYSRLEKHLETKFDVQVFDYDWRLPILDEGRRLGRAVDRILKSTDQPVSIVAHSMGGLLARAMMIETAHVWEEMKKRKPSRLVMLGTPNGGSVSMAAGLIGKDSTIRMLERVDIFHNMEQLLSIVSRMPGVLDLLPHDGDGKYLRRETWEEYSQVEPDGWVIPDAADLARSDDLRKKLARLPGTEEHVRYIAGHADATPVSINILENARGRRKLKIMATSQGDGRVPWKTGILDPEQTWYAQVKHGDLANHPGNFDAIVDLIELGTTDRIPDSPPAVARGPEALFEMPEELLPYPDEQELLARAIGSTAPLEMDAVHGPRTRVSVVHGNLTFAKTPVMVGHYENDVLIGAEAYLDSVLGGQLGRRRDLGLYPGKLETHLIIFGQDQESVGAVVVGLGKFGELMPTELTQTMARAFTAYALEWKELRAACLLNRQNGAVRDPGPCRINSLIVGYRDNKLKIRDSLNSILEGLMRANSLLAEDERIEHLQFVELYLDTALAASEILQRLGQDSRFSGSLDIAGEMTRGNGGLQRYTFGDESNWLQRIEVVRSNASGEEDTLVYKSLNDDALAEQHLKLTDRSAVDQYISKMTASTRSDPEIGQVLYEMMLPGGLKNIFSDGRPLQLILDDDAAAYPWELLDDSFAEEDKPIAYRAEIIRQLLQEEFGGHGIQARRGGVLIVGDPVSSFQELPGAQKEAAGVNELFRQFAWQNIEYPQRRPSADWLRRKLYLGEYQVLHLAGHGVYEYSVKTENGDMTRPVTGMVIGDNQFLTAENVSALRRVPEFVFLNCCHLGKVEALDANTEKAIYLNRHRLAANLATQFIRCGARAVVAAGWEVDDTGALIFAESLYRELLAGRQFGEAVLKARRETYDASGVGTNTWGAYQCYGDFQYRLRPGTGAAPSTGPRFRFFAREQVIIAAGNVSAKAQSMSAHQGRETYRRELEAIEKELDRHIDWTDDANLLVALADAYQHAGETGRAIELYEQALHTEEATVPIRGIEQLANLLIKQNTHGLGPQDDRTRANDLIDRGIEQFELLNRLMPSEHEPGLKGTSERHCLIGSAYKRKAILFAGQPRRINLAKMKDAYGDAHRIALSAKGTVNHYPAVNHMLADVLLQLQSKQTAKLDPKLLAKAKESARKADAGEPDFWNRAAIADIMLVEMLADRNPGKLRVAIVENYNAAWRRGGSSSHLGSVREHLEFIETMLDNNRMRKAHEKRLATLAAIRAAIASWDSA